MFLQVIHLLFKSIYPDSLENSFFSDVLVRASGFKKGHSRDATKDGDVIFSEWKQSNFSKAKFSAPNIFSPPLSLLYSFHLFFFLFLSFSFLISFFFFFLVTFLAFTLPFFTFSYLSLIYIRILGINSLQVGSVASPFSKITVI